MGSIAHFWRWIRQKRPEINRKTRVRDAGANQRTAIGFPGAPVAPTSFIGEKMKANS